MPTFGEAQKSLNCLYNGMASPLKLLAFTDRSAYCPRERMMLTTDIKNLPLTQTYQTTVFLVQTISFKSRCGKSRTDRCQRKMVQRSSLSWAVDELEVPDVPPTMRNCGILSISYHVKVEIYGWQKTDWTQAWLKVQEMAGRELTSCMTFPHWLMTPVAFLCRKSETGLNVKPGLQNWTR